MNYEDAWKQLMATIEEYANDPPAYALMKITAKAHGLQLRISYSESDDRK